jgi:hypothetical protein
VKQHVTHSNGSVGRGNFDYDALVSERLRKFPFPTLWTTEDLARDFGIGVEHRQHLSRALRKAGIKPSAKLPITDPVSKKKIRTRLWRIAKFRTLLHTRDDLRVEYYRQWRYYLARVETHLLITQDLQQVTQKLA